MAKICIVCAHGGHLTEALHLIDAFKGHEIFFITYKGARPFDSNNKYLFLDPGMTYHGAIARMLTYIPAIIKILLKDKPKLIVSTGGEIAIPVFYLAKLFGSKTIFIETWTKIHNPTLTGRIVYPITDIFLVQWPELLQKYGKKARFVGGIV